MADTVKASPGRDRRGGRTPKRERTRTNIVANNDLAASPAIDYGHMKTAPPVGDTKHRQILQHRQKSAHNGGKEYSSDSTVPRRHLQNNITGDITSYSGPTDIVPDRMTPARSTSHTTPAKAYAGPNFHASPAASALPFPKFFSKSVPSLDKGMSLKRMMENEGQQEAGSESEASPFDILAKATPKRNNREDSPLDILFRADREEKARSHQSPVRDFTLRQHAPVNRSGSPSRPAVVRQHTRTTTEGRAEGMFAFEQDPVKDTLHAQSLALKQLLQTPGSSRQGWENSSSPRENTRLQTMNCTDSVEVGQFSHSAHLIDQIPVARSSGLRQEMQAPASPSPGAQGGQGFYMNAAPSTPSPRERGKRMPTQAESCPPGRGYASVYNGTDGGARVKRSLWSPEAAGIPTPAARTGNVGAAVGSLVGDDAGRAKTTSLHQSMEDDLRRMLKLDGS